MSNSPLMVRSRLDWPSPMYHADELVDVGELVAGGIHLEVVGVAVEHRPARARLLDHPRTDRGHAHLARAQDADDASRIEVLVPVIEARFLGQVAGLVVVVGVPLLVDVLGQERGAADAVVGEAGHHVGRHEVGSVVGELHRMLIQRLDGLGDLHAQELRQHAAVEGAQDLLVLVDVVPEEGDVFRHQRLAVRPAHPFAQAQGQAHAVLGHVPARRQVGQQRVTGGRSRSRSAAR